jgi:putative aldouronate transport system permease protein
MAGTSASTVIRRRQRRVPTDVFDVVNVGALIILCVVMAYPLWYTIVGSLMEESEFLTKRFLLYPERPTLAGYQKVFEDGTIFIHYRVTVLITVVGTVFSLFVTSVSAYGLSKKFYGSTFLVYLAVFTMFIRPGLIADYLNLRSLGLINNFFVYILPAAINTFYLIIMRTYFIDFPSELEEAARIDGSTEFGTFIRIVLPLSKPVLAAIGLFFAVQYWNTYMQSVFFITDQRLKTVQEYLQRLVTDSTDIENLMAAAEVEDTKFSAESLRLANVVLVLVPIILVYPFLQKYFIRGLMIGAVKG